jgi:hypothetical protein
MEKKKMDESGISRRSFLKISAALGAAASMVGLPALSAESEAKAKTAAMAPFKKGMINTAMGPMSPDKLGTTLMHEHFAFGYPGWYADATIAPYDLQEFLKTNLKEIKIAQSSASRLSSMPRPMIVVGVIRSCINSWPRRRASTSSAPPGYIQTTKGPRPISRPEPGLDRIFPS